MSVDIGYVLTAVPCKDHDAPIGTACFTVRADQHPRPLAAICNARARRAGCVGLPSRPPKHPQNKPAPEPLGVREATGWQERLRREVQARQEAR